MNLIPFKIVDARDGDGKVVPMMQRLGDTQALSIAWNNALREDAGFWLFGGILTVDGREYQVASVGNRED